MSPAPQTVLLIEDDDALRDTLNEILEGEGYRVVQARNGREGLQALETQVQGPCLILMDVLMPVMDGHQVLAELHRRPELLGDSKLILCTGTYDYQFGPPAPHCVLRKPYNVPALLRILEYASPRGGARPPPA